MIWKLDAWLINVKTAFLHGDFDKGERIFMEIPKGMKEVEKVEDDDCLELLKTCYGTVQAARQWWKKFVSILRDIGFEGGKVDPCLWHWKGKFGIVLVGLYVDDCLCIGHKEGLKLFEMELKK